MTLIISIVLSFSLHEKFITINLCSIEISISCAIIYHKYYKNTYNRQERSDKMSAIITREDAWNLLKEYNIVVKD